MYYGQGGEPPYSPLGQTSASYQQSAVESAHSPHQMYPGRKTDNKPHHLVTENSTPEVRGGKLPIKRSYTGIEITSTIFPPLPVTLAIRITLNRVSKYHTVCTIVRKVEHCKGFFAAGDQTSEFLPFKGDLIWLPTSVILLASDRVDH